MDLVEVGWGDVDWIGLAQDRDKWRALVNSVLNIVTQLSNPPSFRRLRKLLPSDLPYRFTGNT
jgi:hypothetical protein